MCGKAPTKTTNRRGLPMQVHLPSFFPKKKRREFPVHKKDRFIHIYSPKATTKCKCPDVPRAVPCGLCVLHNIPYYILFIFMPPHGAAGGLIPSRAGRVRVPGFFVFPEVVLPPPVFLLIYPCAAGCDRTRLSFHFTKGPGQIVPRCYLDDAERVHAVLCRERGQGSRV